jgi:signal transduction histidine kinase
MLRSPEFLRTTTFRWAVSSALAFASAVLLLFGLTYWQTAGYLTRQVDRGLLSEAASFMNGPANDLRRHIEWRLQTDPRHFNVTGLFGPDGRLLAGNIAGMPAGLPPPGNAARLGVSRILADGSQETRTVRVVDERLPDGRILVLGKDVDAVNELTEIVTRALLLGAVPMAILAIAAGAFLSIRTRRRIEAVHHAARAIMRGQLAKRLPLRGTEDDFDHLAEIVNRMLGEIERLMHEIKGVGDEIAHDLRTPLTRLRARMERAHNGAAGVDELRVTLGEAIDELDQILATMEALLRIAEIEVGRRRAGFKSVEIGQIAAEVNELYEPVAEDKGVVLSVDLKDPRRVDGDRDLLFEAITNIVDNAVKFTPRGGSIAISVLAGGPGPILRVDDTGGGIAAGEREAVLRRFYRSDRSRHQPGTGLGLNLVAAIARLHGFHLSIEGAEGKGCSIGLECWPHDEVASELPRPSQAPDEHGSYTPDSPTRRPAEELQ